MVADYIVEVYVQIDLGVCGDLKSLRDVNGQ